MKQRKCIAAIIEKKSKNHSPDLGRNTSMLGLPPAFFATIFFGH